ncbi:hypothetical protein FRC07_015069 [Ceratobasidium sp. 392]|nr:hypothetical protein FRC07_015069 [Ceratobasidium sp. 392]
MAFEFKPFTSDLTPHAQLQEWADYYHVDLRWEENKTQEQGITEWTSYPINCETVEVTYDVSNDYMKSIEFEADVIRKDQLDMAVERRNNSCRTR